MQDHPRCVIDIEASGFGRHSYPIEIGYVRDDGRLRRCVGLAGGEIGYVRDDGLAWCSLVRPAGDWLHWDPQAAQVHGIALPQLLQHGRPAAEVAQRLNDDLGGRTVYCDGWAHDYPWLGLLFEVAGLVPRFKLESVNRLLDDAQLARLDAERQQAFTALGIARHRASSDARALQWALGRLAA